MRDNRLGAILWRGKYLVLIAVISMTVASLIVTRTTDKVYEATTLLQVQQSVPAQNGSDAYNAEQASQTQAVTYATLLTSPSFLNRLSPRIDGGFAFSGASLAEHVSARAITGTNLVAVNFTDGTQGSAVHFARVVAVEAIRAFDDDFDAARSRQRTAVGTRVKAVETQIADLETDTSKSAQRQRAALRLASDALTVEYGRELSRSSAGSPVVLVAGPPSAPSSPVSPRPLLNVVAGVMLGLLVGIALAWLYDKLAVSGRRRPAGQPVGY